jgi:hypothetical protein
MVTSVVTTSCLSVGQSVVDAGKCLGMGCYMAAEPELQPPTSDDHAACEVDHLLDDGLDPSPLCLMADYPLASHQAGLSYEPKDVVHQGAAGHDQLIRGKFP